MATKVEKMLTQLAKRYDTLANIKVDGIIETDRVITLLAPGDSAAPLVGKEGAMVKMLSRELGKLVKVISTREEKRLIADLLRPVTLTGINVLYTTDGGELLKVRVPLKDKALLHFSEEDFSLVTNKILGKRVQLIFE